MSGKCLQFVHNQYGSLTNPTEKLVTTLRPLDRTHHHLRSGTDIQSSFPDPIRPQILYHSQLDAINTANLQRLPLDPVQSDIFSGHISQPDTQLILPFSTKRIYQRGDHGRGRKTSEDTVSTSLHIKGTPTASQETNCIPNSQNTAKTSIPSTRAQFKRRSFRRFLAISRRDGSTVLPLIRAGSRMIVVVAPMVSPALFSLLTRAPFLDSGFFSDVRIHVSMADTCRLWRPMSPSEARHTYLDPSHGTAGRNRSTHAGHN